MSADFLNIKLDSGLHMAFVSEGEEFEIPSVENSLISEKVSSKRRNEFHLGREAARRAFRKSGIISPAVVGRDAQGRPLWPEGFSGSISHSEGLAVCLLSSAHRFVGVDLQKIREVNPDLKRRVCTVWERKNLQQLEVNALEVFSIKRGSL